MYLQSQTPHAALLRYTSTTLAISQVTNGVTATSNATVNTKGSWVSLASTTYTANDSYGLLLHFGTSFTSATAISLLFDVGVDPAGGTSYTPLIENICGGQFYGVTSGLNCTWLYFPIYVKAGSTLGLRAQSSVASKTIVAASVLLQQPRNPSMHWCGSRTETLGANLSTSQGVALTPGNATKGSWVSIGTTSYNNKYWAISPQIVNSTTNTLAYYVDIAYGDASNKSIIAQDLDFTGISTTESSCMRMTTVLENFCDVPAGSTIYARAACSGAPDSGFNLTVIGVR